MMQHLKILPVLIVVALLTFSVRLVDFATGVSSLSGAAFAKSEDKPAMPDHAVEDDHKSAEKKDEETSHDKTNNDHTQNDQAKKDEPEIKWRDAKDETVGAEDVRHGVMDDLASRRLELDARERDLQTREALLRAAQQELDLKYKELSELRTQIEGLLNKQSEEQERIGSLVKIYEGMKPKDAARIFDTLDLDVLVTVMSRMSERKLSPVLAAMNPERARTITIMLAEEKSLPTLP